MLIQQVPLSGTARVRASAEPVPGHPGGFLKATGVLGVLLEGSSRVQDLQGSANPTALIALHAAMKPPNMANAQVVAQHIFVEAVDPQHGNSRVAREALRYTLKLR